MTAWGDWGAVGFWIAAGGMSVVVAALLILALVRGQSRNTPTAMFDLQVYRDQLREVERDLSRGVIGPEEAARVRTEVSRRVLEADRALKAEGVGKFAPRQASWAVGITIALTCLAAVWLYERVGAPGYPDLPLQERLAQAKTLAAERPDQAAAEADAAKRFTPPPPDPKYLDLVQKLRAAVAKRPDDLTGHVLLVQNEARLGHFHAAWQAQKEVIRIKGKDATAADYAQEADLMIIAAGGYVSPEAQAVLREALTLDRTNGTARFYWGLMEAQIGRPDLGFRTWEALLATSPADAPWVAPIRAQIEQMAQLAGVRFQLPPAPGAKGPSAADMAAAQDMTPAQRQEMIRGMVQGLAERLDSDGGSAADWARLIGAYGVLGEADKQAAALAKARDAYKDKPGDLAVIEGAAKGGAPMATAPALPGPSASDMQAAQDMTPEDRQKMIEGMVQRLNDKLASEGGTAPEWARLIGAYGVLGNTERAQAIWTEAQTRFAAHPDQLAIIRDAAVKAGVAK